MFPGLPSTSQNCPPKARLEFLYICMDTEYDEKATFPDVLILMYLNPVQESARGPTGDPAGPLKTCQVNNLTN